MDEELHLAIEQRAYELWQNADRPDGRELQFWLQAEQEIGMSVGASNTDPFLAPDDLDPGEFQRREPSAEHAHPQPTSPPSARSA